MNYFEKQVLSFIREKNMLPEGAHVVAGVSGGADSVCLLSVLHRLQRVLKITLSVVHVNHMIRDDAGEDAAFVEALCRELDVSFTLVEKDVRAYAKENGIGEEEAGRLLRYEALRDTEDVALIATAHTADDVAETVLFHLFRGSGMAGASGIRPVNGDIIRPLLRTTHTEIIDYLRAEGIAWREDQTNEGDDYARNRIRHHILPAAEEMINEGASRHLAEAAETFALAEEYLKSEAEKLLETACDTEDGSLCINTLHRKTVPSVAEPDNAPVPSVAEPFTAAPLILQQEAVRLAISRVTPHLKDISRRHIDAVLDLCRNTHGVKELTLPDGVKVVRDHDRLFFKTESENS